MSDGLQQLVDFNLVNVKSDTSHPIQNNLIQTIRSHDCNSVENATLLNRIEAVKLKTEKISSLLNVNSVLDKVSDVKAKADQLQTLIGINQSHEISDNLFNDSYPLINDIERLKVLLSEVNIRFDNAPKNYQKEDYFALLRILNKSLLFLYNQIDSVIVSSEEAKKAAEYAKTQGDLALASSMAANDSAEKANEAANDAKQASLNAENQAIYAKEQGDYAKTQADKMNEAMKFVSYYDSALSFPTVGEEYKIYVDLTTEKIYLYHNGYINIGNSSDWHDIELIDGSF